MKERSFLNMYTYKSLCVNYTSILLKEKNNTKGDYEPDTGSHCSCMLPEQILNNPLCKRYQQELVSGNARIKPRKANFKSLTLNHQPHYKDASDVTLHHWGWGIPQTMPLSCLLCFYLIVLLSLFRSQSCCCHQSLGPGPAPFQSLMS